MTTASGAVPAKMVVLESYWNRRLFNPVSVRGFFESLAPLMHPPLAVAHRFVESRRGLEYYTRRPGGLLWTERDAWDAPVYYLAFHGGPAKVISVTDPIGARALCEAFAGYGGYDNLVYFAACSVLRGARGRAFAKRFLRVSGCRAVFGYSKPVDWVESLVVDLLFLKRFYGNPQPWRNLAKIVASVRRDLPLARRLGWTCVRAGARKS